MDKLQELFASLNERRRPEDIAHTIKELLQGHLTSEQEHILQRAAKGSLKQQVVGYTSMMQRFTAPVGLQRQVATARTIFQSVPSMAEEKCDDPAAVEEFIRHIGPEIRKAFGENDYKTSRLNHKARLDSGLDLSRRRYNKLFRHLTRMERKLHTLLQEYRKFEFTKIGKSGLAWTLSWETFSSNLNSACFISYYTARCNLRSEFTISGQQRPYDEIANMLFSRCKADPNTNWLAITHAYPAQEAISHLRDEQKGELLGKWFAILQDVAGLLEETWRNSDFKRETMVVKRGDDSSTWNNTASAWNKARDNWIALLFAMHMEEILEWMCIGKVLRLMAADVVAWHYLAGGGLDPNTAVWSELPLPWEVLAGTQQCPKVLVEAVCRKYKVDPVKSGWIAPKSSGIVAKFRSTPELVHGVTVGNPFLAKLLREAGFFSGKTLRLDKIF